MKLDNYIRIRLLDELYIPSTVDWRKVESAQPNTVGPLPEHLPVSAAIVALPENRAIVRAIRQRLLEAIAIGRQAWYGRQVLSGFENQDNSPGAIGIRKTQREFEQYCERLALLAAVPQRYALKFSG